MAVSIKSKKYIIISGAIALIVVLYFQSTHLVSKTEVSPADSGDYFTALLKEARSSLKRQEAEQIKNLETVVGQAGKDASSVSLLDSIAHSWQRYNPGMLGTALAAHYFEEAAVIQPGEKAEINAGASYYRAFNLAIDSGLKAFLLQGAIRNYEKAIKSNPGNADVKADLALCYAEGNNPMQGILLLREVVALHPDHEAAQYNLGILSIRSGQWEKAAERFSKVVEINPSRYDVYFLRGTTYMRMGKKEKAFKDFQKVKKESPDAQMSIQADQYISKLTP
jgi:tetratricopeptide (TPR) repeat protein